MQAYTCIHCAYVYERVLSTPSLAARIHTSLLLCQDSGHWLQLYDRGHHIISTLDLGVSCNCDEYGYIAVLSVPNLDKKGSSGFPNPTKKFFGPLSSAETINSCSYLLRNEGLEVV